MLFKWKPWWGRGEVADTGEFGPVSRLQPSLPLYFSGDRWAQTCSAGQALGQTHHFVVLPSTVICFSRHLCSNYKKKENRWNVKHQRDNIERPLTQVLFPQIYRRPVLMCRPALMDARNNPLWSHASLGTGHCSKSQLSDTLSSKNGNNI